MSEKQRVKEIFKSLDRNEAVRYESDHDFLLEYFSKHPQWEQKQGAGLNYFFKAKNEWNESFAVMSVDGTHQFISMNFTKTLNKKADVLSALRNAIQPQCDQVRNALNFGVDKCELTGEILVKKNTHIDHYDLDFKDVVRKFMKMNEYSFDYLYDFIFKIGVKYFINEKISLSFAKFHSENTHLRAVTSHANLTRKK